MLAKRHPFTCCPAAKHQNAADVALQTFEKNQQTFYGAKQASTLVSEIILPTSVPLQKFLFL